MSIQLGLIDKITLKSFMESRRMMDTWWEGLPEEFKLANSPLDSEILPMLPIITDRLKIRALVLMLEWNITLYSCYLPPYLMSGTEFDVTPPSDLDADLTALGEVAKISLDICLKSSEILIEGTKQLNRLGDCIRK